MPNPRRIAETVDLVRDMGPGPIRTSAAEEAATPARVRAAVAAQALLVLRRGILVPACDWTNADRSLQRRWALQGATLLYPAAFGSHDTAGLEWGLPDYRVDVGGDPPRTHLSLLGAGRESGWIRIHGVDTAPDSVVRLHGQPVTSLVRTSIDLAATRSRRDAVVFIDAAMRLAAATTGPEVRERVLDPGVREALWREWDRAVAAYTRHRWVANVRWAIRYAEPAAESVLESLSRAAMIEAELPLPRCGVPVVGDDGRTYWVDFLWDEYRLIGEADGLTKYTDVGRLVEEKRRQEALEGRGFRVVRWGMGEVRPSPTVMLGRIRGALAWTGSPTRLEPS